MKKITISTLILLLINTITLPKTFAQEPPSPPDVHSESAIMIEANTGEILYSKDKNRKMYPASLTKIATTIYAIEKGDLTDIVTVSKNARFTEGTRVFLDEGEKVTLNKLLQGLLINSGNDAGVAIAEHMSGSVEQFASDLNQYLKDEIGIENTTFANPHGLFDPNHVTTSEDLAKVTQYAIKNKIFREIFGTKVMEWDGEAWDSTLYTHHKLMREDPYEGITGGKTGYVSKSGFTLATTAKRDNLSLIVITLKSENWTKAYQDTKNLLDYGFENFATSDISPDKTFSHQQVQYTVAQESSYTHLQNETLHEEVTENDTLQVVNEDGDVESTFPLEKKDKPKKANQQAFSSDDNPKQEQEATVKASSSIVIGLFAALSFLWLMILRRKNVNKEHHYS